MMNSAHDPFHTVKQEIEDSIGKLQKSFHKWQESPPNSGELIDISKELIASCDIIEWQVNELDKTITVAAKDPTWYRLNDIELDKRRSWATIAHNQVDAVRNSVVTAKKTSYSSNSTFVGMRKELLRLPNDGPSQGEKLNYYTAEDNDDFITSESDRQQLLIKRQDEELDELSASVQRIGDVGLTIHEELSGQDRILGELQKEMETTSNRLGFVQKKVGMVMKKAGAKGQWILMAFLVGLFILLFVLVFLT